MRVIFMDESGYSLNWQSDLETQPYYVVSAVCFPSEQLSAVYKKIREEVINLNIEGTSRALGHGFEIKARDISRGSGYWGTHNDERNAVRKTMLAVPRKYDGTAFVVIIDKRAHKEHYAWPADPYELSLEFIFERLQMFLSDIGDYGICIYDQNKRVEDALQNAAANLIREGSELIYFSRFYNLLVIKRFRIDRIIEFSLGRSEYSVGLQVADFFATMTYAYMKDGKPSPCGWWDVLESSLYRKDGKLQGVGYKEFP